MKIREYYLKTPKKNIDMKICVVSDLHSRPYSDCLDAVLRTHADIIILAGDMLERLDGACDEYNKRGLEFLEKVSKIAPTYYTFGNHECFGSHRELKRNGNSGEPSITLENLNKIKNTGVHILNDFYELLSGENNVLVGGVMPACDRPVREPNLEFIKNYSLVEGFKILISHQPEYYDKYFKDLDFDLILSGHTHGGQWKFFGRGVYAPNQGFFPQYSSGTYHSKLIVSAGASNTEIIPRFFNPCEIVVVNIKSI